ncbi:hypothetical protein [Psychrobacter sp. DAB_AL62B]|uniref:hypothetical protein n=1 Tax=Psychrobacter sp. DAB_AL62B TaxID=1028420 RepID=UPI0023816AC0|nr:hypothetical protein [Psychrobacter sp. DAB_AL62B]MDE4455232.1 hypothetical protein [Psychrobacter sp. DAB_AL62B]
MKQSHIEDNESNSEFSKNVKVSQEEIAKRRILYKHVLGSIGVGDSPINPNTRHIFNDFVEGRIATTEEVREKLIKYYSQIENE